MIYLAVPYSHDNPKVREVRFEAANRAAAILIQKGHHVFSPISHTHPIALCGDLPKGWEYWEEYDRIMLGACDTLAILRLDGWRESTGVQAEIKIASETKMVIFYVDDEPI